MNRKLTTKVIELGATDQAKQAMRARRDELLDWIQTAETAGGEIPEFQMRGVLAELFDLNIAIGDAVVEDKDKDGAQ